jgi:hypothetical protein
MWNAIREGAVRTLSWARSAGPKRSEQTLPDRLLGDLALFALGALIGGMTMKGCF